MTELENNEMFVLNFSFNTCLYTFILIINIRSNSNQRENKHTTGTMKVLILN